MNVISKYEYLCTYFIINVNKTNIIESEYRTCRNKQSDS